MRKKRRMNSHVNVMVLAAPMLLARDPSIAVMNAAYSLPSDVYTKFCLSEWQNGKKTPSYADAKAEETLKELAKKKQEAQNKLLELDRLSNELDAFVERTKSAVVEETEVSCCYFGGNGHFGTGLRRFAVLGFRF
ncbi:PREDICTED: uncharacterized protein LOC107334950 [Acropora digitifera]|uniref:uncharacterized protein LOC107334950 n=1 Tax=Acropora digitifera TaxID=70779 RepID=UPI000779FD48|nr:PREDICTED: uncharacterized protein LOC107334950 [Acropora digitifera]XP_015755402.1 PREDICTED: uncharacterized protein LOC107334950 [Acropora digitifera]